MEKLILDGVTLNRRIMNRTSGDVFPVDERPAAVAVNVWRDGELVESRQVVMSPTEHELLMDLLSGIAAKGLEVGVGDVL